MRNTRQDNVVAFVGRQNSGKTTLVVKLIEALAKQSIAVSSVKHHGHKGFEIDIPGKDSYRHHHAGTIATGVLSPDQYALVEVKDFDDAREAVALLPASNLVLIEGFRESGFPTVELIRADNPKDVTYIDKFLACCTEQDASSLPCAVVTDIDVVAQAATERSLPVFGFDDIDELCSWLIATFSKPLVSVALQAGGESRRMGQSKALVEFLGRPLIEHMVARVAPIASDLLITTREPDKFTYLQGHYPGLRLVDDIYPTRGALFGLATALSSARYDLVNIVACDMPLVDPALLELEASLLARQPEYAACVPEIDNRLQPLYATYRKDVCLDALETFAKSGNQRLSDFLATLPVLIISEQDLLQASIGPSSCVNTNTPQELAAVYEMLAHNLIEG